MKDKDLFGNEPRNSKASVRDLAKHMLLPDYEKKFEALEKIAFELHQLKEEELEMRVIKKMAGIKLMINYINR